MDSHQHTLMSMKDDHAKHGKDFHFIYTPEWPFNTVKRLRGSRRKGQSTQDMNWFQNPAKMGTWTGANPKKVPVRWGDGVMSNYCELVIIIRSVIVPEAFSHACYTYKLRDSEAVLQFCHFGHSLLSNYLLSQYMSLRVW